MSCILNPNFRSTKRPKKVNLGWKIFKKLIKTVFATSCSLAHYGEAVA